jgi:hypothetical protein
VGFVLRVTGGRLSAALEECLPDVNYAFEAHGDDGLGVYYTTSATAELNRQFGDLLNRIRDLEARHSEGRLHCKILPQLFCSFLVDYDLKLAQVSACSSCA